MAEIDTPILPAPDPAESDLEWVETSWGGYWQKREDPPGMYDHAGDWQSQTGEVIG